MLVYFKLGYPQFLTLKIAEIHKSKMKKPNQRFGF